MTMNKLATVLLVASLGAGSSGCIISEGGGDLPPDPNPYQPYYTAIDPDYVLDTDLGYGAGLFVEYGSGGQWELWTSCDTKATGATCNYEVHVTSGGGAISNVESIDLEAGDQVDVFSNNTLSFFNETATRSDAIRFTTEPGADLEVELVLDGVVAPQYMVWYADGLVHDGADGSPVVFQPTGP